MMTTTRRTTPLTGPLGSSLDANMALAVAILDRARTEADLVGGTILAGAIYHIIGSLTA